MSPGQALVNPSRVILRKLAGRELAVAWVCSSVFGALAISLTSGFSAMRLLLPVGFMILFGLYAATLKSKNATQVGDSLYFLGFLWTLWALIDSFVLKQETDASAIFTIFGYALLTTAAGMFGRLLFLQFQHTVSDQMLEAREEIESVVTQFTRELSEAGRLLGSFQGALSKSLDEMKSVLESKTENIFAKFGELQRKATEEVLETVAKIAKDLRDIELPFADINAESTAFARKMKGATDTLAASLNTLQGKIELSGTQLQSTISNVEEQVLGLSEACSSLSQNLGGLATEVREKGVYLTETLETTSRTFPRTIDRMLEQAANSEGRKRLETSLSGIGSKLENWATETDRAKERIIEVGKVLSDSATQLQELEAVAISLVSKVDILNSALDKLGTFAVQRSAVHIQEAEKSIKEMQAVGNELRTSVEEVLSFIRSRLREAVR